MGHHLLPLPPDREPTPFNSNSSSCSSILVHTSNDIPSLHSLNTVQSDWTDEKHALYLDSLEASFVKELHQRMHLRALCTRQKVNRKETMSNISSSQLMVFQDASWQNVKFESDDPLMDSTADSPAILEDLRTNHFASAGKQCSLETRYLFEECGNFSDGRSARNLTDSNGFTRSSQQFSAESVEITAEVSDQNFPSNHQGKLSSGMSISKRLKKNTPDSSSNDQVVRFGKLSSEREKQNTNSSSEHPENCVPPRSDLCYYLRGS